MNFEFNAVSSFFWIRKMRKAPDDIVTAIEEDMGAIIGGLVRYIQDNKLSGQVLRERTGALKASVKGSFTRSLFNIRAEVSAGSLPYAEILEDGGTTSPHDITAIRAKVLRWVSRSGEVRFAKTVRHPGSVIPAFKYMSSSLVEREDDIKAQMFAALKRGLAKDLPR